MSERTLGIFRKVRLIGSESKVCSDYLDVIAEKGWEEHVARYIMQFMLRIRCQWHVLVLSSVPSDSAFLAVARQLPEFRCLTRYQQSLSVAPCLSYPETWDKLLAGFGRKTRWNMKYYRRRLEKDFHVQFVRWFTMFNRQQTIELLRRLQQKSISRKGLRGVFQDEAYRDFHADIIELFHKKGWLYIMFLVCDGKPVAFLYAYLYGGRCYDYQIGFDTDYRSYSVGTVLQSYVFQDTIRQGIHTYDFLRGDENYKRHFAKSAREMLRLSIFNSGWSAVLLRLLITCSRQTKSLITNLFGEDLRQSIRARIFKF